MANTAEMKKELQQASGKREGTSDSPVVIRQPQGMAGAGVPSQHPVQDPAEAGVKSCCI